MPFFFKSYCSQTVHEVCEEHNRQEDYVKDEGSCISLTVWRSSLVLSCNGFAVIDSNGDLVYRVDNYSARPSEIVLMDGYGKSLLTICRRKEKLRFVENWLIHQGESGEKNSADTKADPVFIARKQQNYRLRTNVNVLAHIYKTTSDKRHPAYMIEGSYAQRSCKIYDKSRNIVAEIKRKEAAIRSGGGVSFGSEAFVLIVRPGFDQGFAMGLVLLLDQMFS